MLAFLVPFRARATTTDYGRQTTLLSRTLRSILAQNDERFRAAVIAHERPPIAEVDDARVTVLITTLPLPRRTNDDMCADKVLKLTEGIRWAREQRLPFVMFTDADDLVSRRLAAHVAAHPHANGWYFARGFSYHPGDPWLRRLHQYHAVCGTCAIFRTEFLDFGPSELRPGATVCTLAETGHDTWVSRMAERGTPIEPLPFDGAVYVRHEDSLSSIPGGSGYSPPVGRDDRPAVIRLLSRIKHTSLDVVSRRPLTAALRAEFAIES